MNTKLPAKAAIDDTTVQSPEKRLEAAIRAAIDAPGAEVSIEMHPRGHEVAVIKLPRGFDRTISKSQMQQNLRAARLSVSTISELEAAIRNRIETIPTHPMPAPSVMPNSMGVIGGGKANIVVTNSGLEGALVTASGDNYIINNVRAGVKCEGLLAGADKEPMVDRNYDIIELPVRVKDLYEKFKIADHPYKPKKEEPSMVERHASGGKPAGAKGR